MITTSYGTWNRLVQNMSLTVEQDVQTALPADADGNDYSDEQIAAVVTAYRAAINAALPCGVALCGDYFFGDYREEDCHFDGYPLNRDGNLDIGAIVESVDFWAIVETVLEAA